MTPADSSSSSSSRIAQLEEALRFYADKANWVTPSKGFAAQYDPEPAPAEADRGRRARAALSSPTEAPWLTLSPTSNDG